MGVFSPKPCDRPSTCRRSTAADGYAVRGFETIRAATYSPVSLKLPGTAVRISACAPLPDDADTIIPLSLTEKAGNVVTISAAVAPGENVLRRARDTVRGSPLLPKGRLLHAQDLALLATCGIDEITVV